MFGLCWLIDFANIGRVIIDIYKSSNIIVTMELINYVGLKVKIILNNNYYYIGKVLSADDNSLDLIDIKGNQVSLSKNAIMQIQEVGA